MTVMAGGTLIATLHITSHAGVLSIAINTILIRTDMHLPVGRRLTVNGIILSQGLVMIWSARCMFRIRQENRILAFFKIRIKESIYFILLFILFGLF